MEKIDQVPQERNLVDFTQTAENYSEDNQQKIRISNGINLKDLRDEGIVFDPEIPDCERWRREEEKEYFTQHTAELQRVLAERREVQHGIVTVMNRYQNEGGRIEGRHFLDFRGVPLSLALGDFRGVPVRKKTSRAIFHKRPDIRARPDLPGRLSNTA